MITSIIFSKNRPLQLDLCLNSIKENFSQSTENIVIHHNDEPFDDAQKTIESEHRDVCFRAQTDSLFHDVYKIVKESKNQYICFFTDDDIFYAPFACEDYDFLEDTNISCLSLRMGVNIVERSHGGETGPDTCKKGWQTDNGMILWPKTFHGYGSYWSYDLSVDGHIFKKSDMKKMTSELWELSRFRSWKQTPNEFETAIQRFWATGPNLIMAPHHSVVVNSPNNRVQETHNENRSGDVFDYDQNTLLSKYESGARINFKTIYALLRLPFNEIKCPHTEIDILKGLE